MEGSEVWVLNKHGVLLSPDSQLKKLVFQSKYMGQLKGKNIRQFIASHGTPGIQNKLKRTNIGC